MPAGIRAARKRRPVSRERKSRAARPSAIWKQRLAASARMPTAPAAALETRGNGSAYSRKSAVGTPRKAVRKRFPAESAARKKTAVPVRNVRTP